MYRLISPSPSAQRQRGISLLESLIAMVVAALGILGVLGMQMRTLSDTQTTVRRAQAIRLIEDLTERMRVNPNAMADLNLYVSDFTQNPSTGTNTCINACTHSQLAQYDLATWKEAVSKMLPLGQASIFIPSAEGGSGNTGRQLGIMIAWRENERDDSTNYKDNIDSVKGEGGAGTAATCPPNRTCHLQYIPVPARCAPSKNGSITEYFCS